MTDKHDKVNQIKKPLQGRKKAKKYALRVISNGFSSPQSKTWIQYSSKPGLVFLKKFILAPLALNQTLKNRKNRHFFVFSLEKGHFLTLY